MAAPSGDPGSVAPVLSDEEVVRRVLAGDVSQFELIIRRNNQRLYRAARAILRDEGEAEDVVQEAYARAFEHLEQFSGNARFSTWLTRIAVHEALARLRRRSRQQELPETMPSADNPERGAYGRELKAAIEAAIDALPVHYSSVFVLREIEQLSGAETALCLGISEEAVKTRLHRARAFLRIRLRRVMEDSLNHAYAFGRERCDRVTFAVMSRVRTSL